MLLERSGRRKRYKNSGFEALRAFLLEENNVLDASLGGGASDPMRNRRRGTPKSLVFKLLGSSGIRFSSWLNFPAL